VSRPSRFLGRMLRLAAVAGALVAISSDPAAFTLMAAAVVTAVSTVSLVALVAVLGRGARRNAAIAVLRIVLGDRRRTTTGHRTARAVHQGALPRAVHRSIVVVDVEGFGDQRRTNWHQVAVRAGLYRAMQEAFDRAGIPWADCDHEDRGDGVFVLVPAEVPKELLVESLPPALVTALDRHTGAHGVPERMRLRMALHAGEISYDEHGTTAAAVNLAFRLLDADALKAALAASPGVLALIASSWFFQEVVRHNPACDVAAYRPARVTVKETTTIGWIHLPDHSHPVSRPTIDDRLIGTCDDYVDILHGGQANSRLPGS
jgi:hypothetical protein